MIRIVEFRSSSVLLVNGDDPISVGDVLGVRPTETGDCYNRTGTLTVLAVETVGILRRVTVRGHANAMVPAIAVGDYLFEKHVAYYEEPDTGKLFEAPLLGTTIFAYVERAGYRSRVELTIHNVARPGREIYVYAKDSADAERVASRVDAPATPAQPDPFLSKTDAALERTTAASTARLAAAKARVDADPLYQGAIASLNELNSQMNGTGTLDAERQRANYLADKCGQLQHERDEAVRRAEAAEAKAYRLGRGWNT